MTNPINNIKHTVIQSLFSKPYFTKEELQAIADPYISKDNISLDSFRQEVTDLLHPLGFEMRTVTSDYTDVDYYGICQEIEDSNASDCLGLKAEQVQLYYRIVDAVINAMRELTSSVSLGEILDMAPDGMTQVAAQETIEKFCQLGYCEKRGDKVRIGPRGLLEFRPTFVQMENKEGDESDEGLRTCSICLDFILAGIKCSKCNCYIHNRCYKSFNQESWTCPMCQCTDPYIEFGM